jgi:hypothetical protein
MSTQIATRNTDNQNLFWQLANITQSSEQYRIDKNLQYLNIAPLAVLKKIFIQYRFFTQYYITDLALLISKLPFGNLKTILADILYEELGNGDATNAHPQLYDCFLESIGISELEMEQADEYCISNLKTIQSSLINQSWAYGVGLRGMGGECLCQIYLATMHTYFSKNPLIVAKQKEIDWRFWDIHIGEVDLHHQKIVKDAIDELIIRQPETMHDLISGYLESKKAWDLYWAQIYQSAKPKES